MEQPRPTISGTGENPPGSRESGGAASHQPPAAGPLLSPMRELELVEAYRAGDPDAIGALLRSYQRRMYSICYRMVRHHEDARDLAHDAMVKVIEHLDGFDSRARLSTWVYRIAVNTCLSHLRKQKLRQHASLDRAAGQHEEGERHDWHQPQSGELSPTERIEQDEARQRVLRGLDSLDPSSRAILILRDMQDLDYQQIAEVLEKPVGTIKSRLFRAREALRLAIESRADTSSEDS
ncbi:MAG: RNA polymerase sigma factor [Phycisphaerales bacterium]